MKNKTVLIVDDTSFDREVLSRVLKSKLHCDVIECARSSEVLSILTSQTVDIVLMDVVMPEMMGNELVAQIRKNSTLAELPIIMVSNRGNDPFIVECFNLGANDFITKPIKFEAAVARIKNHLRLAESIKDRVRLQELVALNAMIATFNHEINNPLTIAMAELENIKEGPHKVDTRKIEKALRRISEIVQKVTEISKAEEIQYQDYSGAVRMVKIRKES